MDRAKAGKSAWTSVLVFTGILLLCGNAVAEELRMTSSSMLDAIESRLEQDPAVPLNAIDIQVKEGIVTLQGEVGNLLARERAEKITATVKGVNAVINEIKVEPPETIGDAKIEARIEQALLADPATDTFEINAEVAEGVVTLIGTVSSWQEQQLVKRVASGVRGVRQIEEEIIVNYQTDRPDSEIRAEVMQTYQYDVNLDASRINVRVEEGRVILSGEVASAAEKTQAIFEAWVAGVRDVNAEDLTVTRWAEGETFERAPQEAGTDEEIANAVEFNLLRYPRVSAFNVNAEVENGIVTLRGNVDNLRAKRAAKQAARDTVGVQDVKNRIRVRPGEDVADEQVEQRIAEAVRWDPFLETQDISVVVRNGVVRIYGIVDTLFEKTQAEEVISRIKGVTGIKNFLGVYDAVNTPVYEPFVYDYSISDYDWLVYEPEMVTRPDPEIAEDIRQQFFWSPFVDGGDIEVQVEEGVATLDGQVASWAEQRSATENALEGGAGWVINNLQVA